MSTKKKLRGGVCIDGFNLYHSIDDLEKTYLKWLDLWKLSENLSKGHAHEIVEVFFCTAFFKGDFQKKKRHECYNAALEAKGVEVLLGHTTKEPVYCRSCEYRWDAPREKETDINLAMSMFSAAMTDRIDVAFLITADTDQAASLKFMKEFCPGVKRVVVTPSGRNKSKHLRDLSDANIQLTEEKIDLSVFPAMVVPSKKGRTVVRPEAYNPPIGWVHPDERP